MRVMKTPPSVEIDITNQCNLRCKYCSHFASAGEVSTDLPTEDWLQFFEELGRCAVMNLTLAGGEPFMREDLREIIKGIVRNRMRFSILSNGTLITDDIAAFIASTRRCEAVQVSIDGSAPEVHDFMRGSGTFGRALEGIGCLQRHGVQVCVRVTIHRRNVHHLEDIARFLLEDIGLPMFDTNAASHMGLCRKNAEEVQLNAAERSLAMSVLLRLQRTYGGRIAGDAGPLADARTWLLMDRSRREGRAPSPGDGHLTGCGGAMQRIGVRADGVIVPCCQISHIELGRINRESLQEIWQCHSELDRIRKRRTISLVSFEFCQDCEYINYCKGGCPALAYTLLGEVNHPSPDLCLKRFFQDGGSLPNETLLSASKLLPEQAHAGSVQVL